VFLFQVAGCRRRRRRAMLMLLYIQATKRHTGVGCWSRRQFQTRHACRHAFWPFALALNRYGGGGEAERQGSSNLMHPPFLPRILCYRGSHHHVNSNSSLACGRCDCRCLDCRCLQKYTQAPQHPIQPLFLSLSNDLSPRCMHGWMARKAMHARPPIIPNLVKALCCLVVNSQMREAAGAFLGAACTTRPSLFSPSPLNPCPALSNQPHPPSFPLYKNTPAAQATTIFWATRVRQANE
jgi:hypothetical protein